MPARMTIALALAAICTALASPLAAQGFDRDDRDAVVRAYLATLTPERRRQETGRPADSYCIAAPRTFPRVTVVRVLSPHGETCVIMGAFLGARFEPMSGEAVLWRHARAVLQEAGWATADARGRERLALAWTVEVLLPRPHARIAGTPRAETHPDGGVLVTVPVTVIAGMGGDPARMRAEVVDAGFAFSPAGDQSQAPPR